MLSRYRNRILLALVILAGLATLAFEGATFVRLFARVLETFR